MAIQHTQWPKDITRDWQFKCDNVMMLSDQLQGPDKETFHFDVRDLHWPTYWEDYVLGIRKYVLKKDNSTLPQARKHLQRLFYLNKMIQFLLMFGFWHLLLVKSQTTRRMWFFLTSLAMKLYSIIPTRS